MIWPLVCLTLGALAIAATWDVACRRTRGDKAWEDQQKQIRAYADEAREKFTAAWSLSQKFDERLAAVERKVH